MTVSLTKSPALAIGDAVDSVAKWNSLPIGAVVTDRDGWKHTKTSDYDDAIGGGYTATYVDTTGGTGNFGGPWRWDARLTSLTPLTPAVPSRPTIDFGTPARATAREYAALAQSKTIDAEHNAVLQEVVDGKEVDAYRLNAALVQALSAATTRHGASQARRGLARQIRHLGYIVQAVIEAHADNLPVYEDGHRSRKIEELRLEVEHAGVVNQSLTQDLTEARQTVEIVGREGVKHKQRAETLTIEIGMLKQAASDERRRLCAEIDGLRAQLAETVDERDTMAAGLNYALEGLTPCGKQRVYGYLDGLS